MDPAVTSTAMHLYVIPINSYIFGFSSGFSVADKYFQIAAVTMLTYDHLITLGQEVEMIWMRPKSAASLLFFLNRYATLAQLIILLVSFNDPSWKGQAYVLLYQLFDDLSSLESCFRCDNYVLFEGCSYVALVAIGQLIMILRVVAIYGRSKKIFVFLLLIWTGQIIISVVGLRTGFAVPLPPGIVGCILTGNGTLFPSLWIAPLIFDSSIFLLTIYRTKESIGQLFKSIIKGGASDRAVTILLRDGLAYYFLIFLANLMNCLVYFTAEPDIKQVGASFSQLLTCTMISRLVLNLRSLSNAHSGHTTRITALEFNNQHDLLDQSTSTQAETIWSRTLNDFTETEAQVERTHEVIS
ncbi:hypothetical protein AGABI2DRAFT_117555 [Agaricus bisporus var. bisporus H97]|uniref:hypothetical protein n=1 Tax=Agaricus bisporus var. bisporus (strain H97 / ATCC MYA-4626 / FGSC 10389) TaxID=936046 RepID=UPI00029F7714|nr:hypothetical protein AGABI2DRAFT_117555 [Agaricus bisporus var. bisporus H97]EKV48755.1 hypothetical protein AGABI2DRAFT_117555 [Agaricus bisporus var. bisporus H97]